MELLLQNQIFFGWTLLKFDILRVSKIVGVNYQSPIGQKIKNPHIFFMLLTKLSFNVIKFLIPYSIKSLLIYQLPIDNPNIFMIYRCISLSLIKLINFTNIPFKWFSIVVLELDHERMKYLTELSFLLLELIWVKLIRWVKNSRIIESKGCDHFITMLHQYYYFLNYILY